MLLSPICLLPYVICYSVQWQLELNSLTDQRLFYLSLLHGVMCTFGIISLIVSFFICTIQ